MFCLIRHVLKNNHNVGCLGKGFYRALGPGIIMEKDNCQNVLDDHLSGQKWVKIEEKLHLFSTGKG